MSTTYKVRFYGVDPLNIGAGATQPLLRDSWRFAFTKDLDGALRFAFNDSGPLVLATAADALEAERDAWKETVHEEISANLAFREAGGALPDEDMPTFCARLIAERDALRAFAQACGDGDCPAQLGYLRVARHARKSHGLRRSVPI